MSDNRDLVSLKAEQNWEQIFDSEAVVAPYVDIYETDDDFVLIAGMPGVLRENVKLKLEEGSLSIFGKVNYNELKSRRYILNENEIGNYFRKFNISSTIDETKIQARFDNGQLIVILPKHDRIKPRSIAVN